MYIDLTFDFQKRFKHKTQASPVTVGAILVVMLELTYTTLLKRQWPKFCKTVPDLQLTEQYQNSVHVYCDVALGSFTSNFTSTFFFM